MAVISCEKLIASSQERGNNVLLKILHRSSKPDPPPRCLSPAPTHHFDFGIGRLPPNPPSSLLQPRKRGRLSVMVGGGGRPLTQSPA